MRHLVAVALLALVACGGDPTEPMADSLTGDWKATQVDVFFDVRFHLVERSPSDVIGSWQATHWGGDVTATRNENAVTLTMIPHSLPCDRGYIIEAERNGDKATGRAFMRTCAGTKIAGQEGYAVTLSR